MPLTIKTIEAAKPKDKPYKISDGAGLYLNITPTGTRTWRTNYRENGKAKTIVYGRYPEISLADARRLNLQRKNEIVNKTCPTFQSIFDQWIEVKLSQLENSKHQVQVTNTVTHYVLPFIGSLPVDSIPRSKLIEVVQKLSDTPETARRVAGRIEMIFNYAIDSGIIDAHGASKLSRVLPKSKVKHHPCIAWKDAGKLLRAIDDYHEPVTRLGLKLIAHTFVRFNELQNMRWSELITDDNIWLIPGERMKMRVPHVVPLSNQVLKILAELKEYSTGDFVLESPLKRGHSISENTLLFALYRLGYRGIMTVHGFRSLASTVLNEQSEFKGDVIERQLAHSETDGVRKAYNRAQYLDKRRELMQWWSDWLTEKYTDQSLAQTIE